MSADDELLKAERRRLAAAFDDVLNEPVPERFEALLAEPERHVVDLGAARARRRGMSHWAAWGGMAATLVLGTWIGMRLAPPAGDSLVATGAIAYALDRQLASAPEKGAAVAVQVSFKARDGRYCRSFSTDSVAGLACRDAGGAWAFQQVTARATVPTNGMRRAASVMPPAVLTTMDDLLAGGEPLNAEQERAARDAGWR